MLPNLVSLEKREVKPYRVDGEIGRIMFDTYWVEQMEEQLYLTVRSTTA
jgi:hypothetical protein